MSGESTRSHLLRLRDLIIRERELAKELDMDGLLAAQKEKDHLVHILSHIKEINEADKPIAAQIRHENRRNAYLFKSALGWIRETMEFFGRRSVTTTYSDTADEVAAEVNGRLLSGMV